VRIAIIAPPWVPVPPPAYGGTEAVLDSLARGLEAAGHDVMLFATGDSACAVTTKWVRARAAGTVEMSGLTELHHALSGYAEARAWGADIVHDHTLVGPVYAAGSGRPAVTTNHGPFTTELATIYRSIANAVPVIALSHHHAESAGAVPIGAVIHHGVDVDRFPIGDGDGGYALCLGRMSPAKGIHVAVRVARAVGVPLRIAAKMREPAERAYFDRQVAPLLGGDFEYVGEVGGREKLDLLAGAMCLLNPINWPEPFGMVMVEALATGTPVVTTPCGSAPELITSGLTGFVGRDEGALRRALQRIDTLDRSRCRKEAAERFSTELFVQRHLALYRRTLMGTGVDRKSMRSSLTSMSRS
jgi:glycosyltransferase involved in cell wall biosynthesis